MNQPTLQSLAVFAFAVSSFWICGEASAASSCATPDNNSTITTCYYDLTSSPSSTQSPTSAVLDGGIFRVPDQNGELGGTVVGTGVFQPFVRIQETANGSALKSNGVESGFNTDGSVKNLLDDHDKGDSNWNHAIKLSDVNKITVCDGGGATGTNCHQFYEFLLDSNEQGNTPNSGISLDEFKLFYAGSGDLTGYTGFDDATGYSNFNITGATLAYNMDAGPGGDASILMDYTNFSGSGKGVDLQALVPVENFQNAPTNSYLYLYTKMGFVGNACQNPVNGAGKVTGNSPCLTPDGTTGTGKTISPSGSPTKAGSLNFNVDAGFEEWSIRKRVPVPSTVLLMGLGLFALTLTGRGRSLRMA